MIEESYKQGVVDRAENEGYERIEVPADSRFDVVLQQREKSLKGGGLVNKFVTVVDDTPSRDSIRGACDDFRELITSESLNVKGIGENTIGYVGFAGENVSDSVRACVTDGYDPFKLNTSAFPIVADRATGEVINAPVPRLKKRGVYSMQKEDAELLFQPPE